MDSSNKQKVNSSEDKGEQEKVSRYASDFKPHLVISTSAAATEGPPIVSKQGYVLGGNGRTMVIKNVDNMGKYDVYTKYLKDHLSYFGLTENDMKKYRKPVLVKVVDADLNRCTYYSNILNKDLTQQLDPIREGLSLARQLSETNALDRIAEIFIENEADTFRAMINDPRTAKRIIKILKDTGVLYSQNQGEFLEDDRTFTSKGKDFLEILLLASVLPDKKLISKARSYTDKILKAIPQFIRMRTLPKEWNIIPEIQSAIKNEYARRQSGMKKSDYLKQSSFDAPELNEREKLVWKAMDDMGIRKFREFLTKYIQSAKNATNSSAMFATNDSPDDILRFYVTGDRTGISDNMRLVGLNAVDTIDMFPETKPQKKKRKKVNYEYIDGNFQVVCKDDKCGIPFDNRSITSPDAMFEVISKKILPKLDLAQEHFIALYMNTANKILGYKVVGKGALEAAVVDTKAVVRNALLIGPVRSVAICHNHPSGNKEPSNEDIQLTRIIKEAFSLFNIQLLDHIIIAGNKFTSLVQEGQLSGLFGAEYEYTDPKEKILLADKEIKAQTKIDKNYSQNELNPNIKANYKDNSENLPTIEQIEDIKPTELPIKGITKQVLQRLCLPFVILIWGRQGSMKSSLAMIFSDEFSNHGKVLYHTNEEKLSDARITDRYKRLGLTSKQVYFDDSGEFQQLVEYLNDNSEIKFVVIDSMNFLDAPQLELIQLKQEFPEISFVIVAHSEKMGRHFKGDSKLAYKADTEIQMENGIAKVLKHRDAPSGREISITNKAMRRGKSYRYRRRDDNPYDKSLSNIGRRSGGIFADLR